MCKEVGGWGWGWGRSESERGKRTVACERGWEKMISVHTAYCTD